MHWCADETLALMMLIPFMSAFVLKLKVWYHKRAKHHQCHEGREVVAEKRIEEEPH